MKKKLFGEKWFIADGEEEVFTCLRVDKDIYSGKSKYQKISVFDNQKVGRVLALDEAIQLTTKGEEVYHEMLVHPAFSYFPQAKKVLIIGGGDGGTLREVAKYSVKEIYFVELDKKVVEISQKYLPSVSRGSFKDKRVKMIFEDGISFVKKCEEAFDIIFLDITDYFGPSKDFREVKFFKNVSKILKKDGVLGAQTGLLQEAFAKEARRNLKKAFPYAVVHKAFVPSFPFGEHTFTFVSQGLNFARISFEEIKKRFEASGVKTRYYNPEIHEISKQIPDYWKKMVY